MSSTPFDNPNSEEYCFSSPLELNNPWQLLQESGKSLPVKDHNTGGQMDLSTFIEQEDSVMAQSSMDKGLVGNRLKSKGREINRRIRHLQIEKMAVQHSAEEGSTAKKLDHNAKERVRRMKLSASYLALRSLLPDSQRSKKRWSAPNLIDRVLEYIPEMENEIEKLTLKKDNMLLATENKKLLSEKPHLELQAPTVSVNEVKKGEVIIQICKQRVGDDVFSNLIEKVEGEGMCIASASTLYVCDDRVCYHLHIQTNGSSLGADYIAVLKDKGNVQVHDIKQITTVDQECI